MDRLEKGFIDYSCKKLGDITHVNVEYSNVKDRKFLTGFECDRVADCGISRSPFSGTINYSCQCPLYTTLTNKLH